MSRSSELDKTVKAYILDCIDPEAYGVEAETEAEKIRFLKDTFYFEKGYEFKRVGELHSMRDWIMGLPSVFNIEYRNHAILDLAKKWGSIPENARQSQEDKILNNWFNLIANKTLQLFNKYK